MKHLLACALVTLPLPAWAKDCVVLINGLARTEASFIVMEEALELEDYRAFRADYPSTDAPIAELAEVTLPRAIDTCGTRTVHFVTHSMGGILLRYWIDRHGVPDRLGQVVMMGPPNQGSEVVDTLGDLAAFGWLNGPAGAQLGTRAQGLPRRLPPVTYPVGVIAGSQSLNPYFSSLLPGPDDGKVSVASTRVDGMTAHLPLPVTHTFMMNNPLVIQEVLLILEHGRFATPLSLTDMIFSADEDEN